MSGRNYNNSEKKIKHSGQQSRSFQKRYDQTDRPKFQSREQYEKRSYQKKERSSDQERSQAYHKKPIPEKVLEESDEKIEKMDKILQDEEDSEIETLSTEEEEIDEQQKKGKINFFYNFQESMEELVEKMLDKDPQVEKNYHDVITAAFTKNKKILKQKRNALKGQIKKIDDQRKVNKQLYIEFLFLQREKIREAKWIGSSYDKCKKYQLKHTPFNVLAEFYQKRFPEDKEPIQIESRTRRELTFHLMKESCRKCNGISHYEDDCSS
jgi:hypothetical protein